MLVNFKIMISTSSHTRWSVFWQLGSIAWFYVVLCLENFLIDDVHGILTRLTLKAKNYLPLIFFISGFILVDAGMEMLDKEIQKSINRDDDQKELDHLQQILKERQRRSEKLTTYLHRGYDFDEATG